MAGIIIAITCVIIAYLAGRLVLSFLRRRADGGSASTPYALSNVSERERDRRSEEVRDMLSHKALGAERARLLWAKIHAAQIGNGLIHQFHRDFCGHGLIRTEAGIILCDIQDGHFPGPAIATWDNETDFVAFFARQSDFTMSGWDPEEPVFHTQDKWYRDNQRIRTAIIDRFLYAPNR